MKTHFVQRLIVLKLILLLTGMGCVPLSKKRKAQSQENPAPTPAAPSQPRESKDSAESEAVMPPTPITGSYLVCRFSDPNRVAALASEGLSLENLVKAPARGRAEGYCQPGHPPSANGSQQGAAAAAADL